MLLLHAPASYYLPLFSSSRDLAFAPSILSTLSPHEPSYQEVKAHPHRSPNRSLHLLSPTSSRVFQSSVPPSSTIELDPPDPDPLTWLRSPEPAAHTESKPKDNRQPLSSRSHTADDVPSFSSPHRESRKMNKPLPLGEAHPPLARFDCWTTPADTSKTKDKERVSERGSTARWGEGEARSEPDRRVGARLTQCPGGTADPAACSPAPVGPGSGIDGGGLSQSKEMRGELGRLLPSFAPLPAPTPQTDLHRSSSPVAHTSS